MNIQQYFRKNIFFFTMIVCLFAFRWSFADQYQIPSGSMEPTIQIGDRVIVNKSAYDLKVPFTNIAIAHTADPQRGDIIVFDNPVNDICMIKRLIGLPGDHVVQQNNAVSINGVMVEGTEINSYEHAVSFVIPEDSYFMMGDNRDNSSDSRVWGLIKRNNIKGRAFKVFYNLRLAENFAPSLDLSRIGRDLN